MDQERVTRRCAIEALRAGVPNRDVVRQLPPVQPDVEERFHALLAAPEAGWEAGKQAPGLLIEGDFGSGKSHWLEYFQHAALEAGCVCSRIVISKETPLHDLAKVYRACAEAALVGDRTGPALEEIAFSYHSDHAPGYAELFEWVHRDKGLDPRFAATLFLFERTTDPELRKRIVSEWTGYPMRVPDLRAALRDLGEARAYHVTRPQRVQVIRRFEFLSRFFRSAGYAGWVILLDEAEMISKYTLRQRARAYSHLAQLLGLWKGTAVPGLAGVFTITKDYTGQVLLGRKNDLESIPRRLEETRDAEYILPAEAGMKAIKGKGIELRPPTRQQFEEIHRRVQALYTSAYGWEAPEIEKGEYLSSTGIRQYIRSWVNTWDLRRLYDYRAEIVADQVRITYDEDADLQRETPEEEAPPAVGR